MGRIHGSQTKGGFRTIMPLTHIAHLSVCVTMIVPSLFGQIVSLNLNNLRGAKLPSIMFTLLVCSSSMCGSSRRSRSVLRAKPRLPESYCR